MPDKNPVKARGKSHGDVDITLTWEWTFAKDSLILTQKSSVPQTENGAKKVPGDSQAKPIAVKRPTTPCILDTLRDTRHARIQSLYKCHAKPRPE